MDISSIRDFVNDHPDGVDIHMVDGAVYRIPHRDYIWFTPSGSAGPNGPRKFATAFYMHVDGTTRLVNALLVHHLKKSAKSTKRRKSA